MEDVQIACSLGQDDLSDRRSRWLALADAAPAEISRTARGLRLRFLGGDEAARELGELAELERECCPFADWTVSGDGALQLLDVTAKSDDAIPAVQELFSELVAHGG